MNARFRQVGVFAVAGLSCLLVLTGCVSQAQAQPTGTTPRETVLAAANAAKEAGANVQYDALKDGTVTFSEYDAAYRNLSHCYQAGGLGITSPVVSPVDGFSYVFELVPNGLEASEIQKIQTTCLNKYWMFVSAAYNTVTPPKMDDSLRVAVIACLKSKGYKTSGDEQTARQFARVGNGGTTERRNATETCVSDEAFRLYPNLSTVNIAF